MERRRIQRAKTMKGSVSTPDLDAIAIKRGIKRTHMEMRARMSRAYSIARQQEITNAQVAALARVEMSTSVGHLASLDAAEFPKMMNRLYTYRLAASLIIKQLNEGNIDPHTFDFSSDKHWEPENV